MQKQANMYARFSFVGAFINLIQMFQYLATQVLSQVYNIIVLRRVVFCNMLTFFDTWQVNLSKVVFWNVGTEKVCCGALNRTLFSQLDNLYRRILAYTAKQISFFFGDFSQRILRPAYEKTILHVFSATLFFKEQVHLALSAVVVAHITLLLLIQAVCICSFTRYISLLLREVSAYFFPALRIILYSLRRYQNAQLYFSAYIGTAVGQLLWNRMFMYVFIVVCTLFGVEVLAELYYSENAARAQSMEVIRTNLIGLRSVLQRTYNTLRQNTITASLMDVIASLVVLTANLLKVVFLLLLVQFN